MVAASSLFAVLSATGSMAAAVLPRVETTDYAEEVLPCMEPSLNFENDIKFKVTSDVLSAPIECSGHTTIPDFRGDQ
ncbi:hypothetical protein CFIMG_007220RA00001 [Ceratocystis fimbriata CBS 114723]|uniref:Uncharacterized protein n=1 Tax=Ceratocystis fimbriata CBS 114723 TaxID=1035309 RepID=A0A2C5XFF4_9PEZI|nr:hypothetical protein CFIMG_007220RA00001 [Ceratocystis fimbriata CBS 114723]